MFSFYCPKIFFTNIALVLLLSFLKLKKLIFHKIQDWKTITPNFPIRAILINFQV